MSRVHKLSGVVAQGMSVSCLSREDSHEADAIATGQNRDTSLFPNTEIPKPDPVCLKEVVEFAGMHPHMRDRHLTVAKIPHERVVMNKGLFVQMLMNLLINAAEATSAGGMILLQVEVEDGEVIIKVHDNGPGVAADVINRIVDPCFTTKPDGSGLGLLSVMTFIDSHNGKLQVGKSKLGGALFEVRFPVQQEVEGETQEAVKEAEV